MKKSLLALMLATGLSTAATAQQGPVTATLAPAPAPVAAAPVVAIPVQPVVQAAPGSQINVSGGTQIRVSFIEELTTEDRAVSVGDRVRLEVAEDVIIQGVVVIPRGTPVAGELTRVRYKGMWGRSGAIEGRVLNMQLNGRTIRLSGAFDDRGVTGTAGVVASIALVPLAGFFVTGTSARISAGSTVTSSLDEDIAFIVPSAPQPQPVTVPAAAPTAEAATPAPAPQ